MGKEWRWRRKGRVVSLTAVLPSPPLLPLPHQAPHSSRTSPQYCISVMESMEGKQQQQPYAAAPSAEEPKSPLPPTQGEGEGGEADSDQGMN